MARHILHIALLLLIPLVARTALADDLAVDLVPDSGNPTAPQMGDHLQFHSVISNDSHEAIDGVIVWLSLVQIDPGAEQPVDLEDWSAHKAVTAARLRPGETLTAAWPLRLIQAGTYRIVVSVASSTGGVIATSPLVDITVRWKPVVESQRVLPVAIGLPLLIGAVMLGRRKWAHTPLKRGWPWG